MTPGTALVVTARRHPGAAGLLAAGLAAAAGYGWLGPQPRAWTYVWLLVLAAAAVALVDARRPLSPGVVWGLGLLAVAHLAGGLAPGPGGASFYETWLVEGLLKFDQAVHLAGSAAVALAVWDLHRIAGRRARPRAVWGWAMAAGLGNEVFEAAATTLWDLAATGGAVNAAWDLAFNAVGAAMAVTVLGARPPSTRTVPRAPAPRPS